MGRYRHRPLCRPELNNPAWFREHYQQRGMTGQAMADLLGVSKRTIFFHLERHGIERRAPVRPRRLRAVEDKMVADYIAGDSLQIVADRYATSTMTVVKTLAREGVARRPLGTTSRKRQSPAWPTLMSDGWLEREYLEKGTSMSQIAGQLGCAWQTVSRAMKAKGIKPRHSPLSARPTAARSLSHRHAKQLKSEFDGCVLCGKTGPVDLHHRDGDRANNARENLVALCRDCHTIAEWFIRPVEMRLRRGWASLPVGVA